MNAILATRVAYFFLKTKRSGNIFSDIGIKGTLLLFVICLVAAAIVIFVVWPAAAGVCIWETDPDTNPNALCQ